MIHLIGRRDHVVKLQGHRFDLGEIEAVLKTHPEVREAAAFLRPVGEGKVQIRAAVLTRRGNGVEGELHRICAGKLPAFARPTCIAPFEQFPQVSIGKIDRLALEQLLPDGTDKARSGGES
jgi:acyl-coenzyme A synthetase/AMP-(fatty) acid ligase